MAKQMNEGKTKSPKPVKTDKSKTKPPKPVKKK